MSKDYFYFNHTDRIVALILLTIIVVISIVRAPQPQKTETEPDTTPTDTVVIVIKDTVRRKNNTDYSRSSAIRREKGSYNHTDSAVKDTVRTKRYHVKQRPSQKIDLNAADSTLLISLPGIGPVYASRIIRYRNQLGGYIHTQQLIEINGLPDSLMEWFIITDTIPVKRIMINKYTVNELRRHPYINFYQARAIVELRHDRGKIKGPEQLSLLEEFTARDLERLLPYMDFR